MSTGYYDQSYPPSVFASNTPTITSINPTTGVTGTSKTIAVVGTNFVNPSTVRVGGIAWTTTWVSATSLNATGTLPAAGTVQVTVTNANGASNQKPFVVTAT